MASLGFLKQIRVPRELLRAVQAFFSVLVLALSGYGTASQTALGFCSGGTFRQGWSMEMRQHDG